MKYTTLTPEHLHQIAAAYSQELLGGSEVSLYINEAFALQIIAAIASSGEHSLRLGSRWDPHTKLIFSRLNNDDLRVSAQANLRPKERNSQKAKELSTAIAQFEQTVLQILATK